MHLGHLLASFAAVSHLCGRVAVAPVRVRVNEIARHTNWAVGLELITLLPFS